MPGDGQKARFPSRQRRAQDLGGPVPLGEERVMGWVGQGSQFRGDFPGGPVVRTPSFPLQGAWVPSLVRELRSPRAAWWGQNHHHHHHHHHQGSSALPPQQKLPGVQAWIAGRSTLAAPEHLGERALLEAALRMLGLGGWGSAPRETGSPGPEPLFLPSNGCLYPFWDLSDGCHSTLRALESEMESTCGAGGPARCPPRPF